MTAATRTNNSGKRKPYADLVCGKTLARERLKGNLKTYFETKGFNYKNYFSDRQIASLLEQVWVQSDNQGRSIITQQTGKRTYTTTINQIAQNLEIVAFKSFALAGVFIRSASHCLCSKQRAVAEEWYSSLSKHMEEA